MLAVIGKVEVTVRLLQEVQKVAKKLHAHALIKVGVVMIIFVNSEHAQ